MPSRFSKSQQGAFALVGGPPCLVSRNRGDDLPIVPRPFGFLRLLDLGHVEVTQQTPVGPDPGAMSEAVFDRQFAHLVRHLRRIVRSGRGDRLEIVENGAVDPGLNDRWRPAHLVPEALGEGAAAVVQIVIVGRGGDQALRVLEAHGLYVVDEH